MNPVKMACPYMEPLSPIDPVWITMSLQGLVSHTHMKETRFEIRLENVVV